MKYFKRELSKFKQKHSIICFYDFAVLETSAKWNHAVTGLFHLAQCPPG